MHRQQEKIHRYIETTVVVCRYNISQLKNTVMACFQGNEEETLHFQRLIGNEETLNLQRLT